MTILLKKKSLINGFFFVKIIILPMLSYFQLLYDYFSLIEIIWPYIIYGYLWLFLITFGYFKLFLVIFSYFNLFHLRLFLAIISFLGYFMLFLAIVDYFNLDYLQLL
jgi:hypothetical protein